MSRRAVVTVGLFVLLGVLALGSAVVGMLMTIVGNSSNDSGGQCAPRGVVPVSYGGAAVQLSDVQRANAETIIAEGYRLGVPRRSIVIALAVARQESGFTNYANDGKGPDVGALQEGIEASLAMPHEGVGSDHGSLGVFQQQWPWWGTMQDLMTPAKAADKFYKALLALPGWESMPEVEAAQAVQRSAFPNAYADDIPVAEQLATGSGSSPSTGCAVPAASGVGTVVEPIAPGARFVDLHNFGDAGSHWARGHTGTDLSAPCGAPVVSATNGTVIVRTDQSWAGEWLVEVSTGPGRLTTWYAHMRAISVRPGEQVSAGQQLGEVGDLGNATGCHLHFEVHPRGGGMYVDDIDPSAWLTQNVGRHIGGWIPTSADQTSFTVATFNTLGSSHTTAFGKAPGMASGAQRTRGLVELLRQYEVDVVGLQEFQRPQYGEFVRLAGHDYILYSARGDTENAIAWNPLRFRLVSSGTVAIPYFDGHVRRMPIVQLADLSTEQHLVVLNVHNPADTRRFPHQGAFRDAAVRKEIELIGNLQDRLGLPVILTGDLNDSRDAFCAFSKSLSMSSASGGSPHPQCRPPVNAGIDWILGTDGVQFTGYQRDRGDLVRQTSDHPFVAARASVGSAP